MKSIRLITAGVVLSTSVHAADPENADNFPLAQCMSRCEPGRDCEPDEVDEFPDFDTNVAEILANCQANGMHYLIAVEGMCADGRKLLHTGTGFRNEIQLFTAEGKFEALIFQPDFGDWICKGQFYWPSYRHCEAPAVVTSYCGEPLQTGAPAFTNKWTE